MRDPSTAPWRCKMSLQLLDNAACTKAPEAEIAVGVADDGDLGYTCRNTHYPTRWSPVPGARTRFSTWCLRSPIRPCSCRPERMDISCGHHLGKADSVGTATWRKVRNPADFKGFLERLAGEPGFEPGLTESESAGLPLTYSPTGIVLMPRHCRREPGVPPDGLAEAERSFRPAL